MTDVGRRPWNDFVIYTNRKIKSVDLLMKNTSRTPFHSPDWYSKSHQMDQNLGNSWTKKAAKFLLLKAIS